MLLLNAHSQQMTFSNTFKSVASDSQSDMSLKDESSESTDESG